MPAGPCSQPFETSVGGKSDSLYPAAGGHFLSFAIVAVSHSISIRSCTGLHENTRPADSEHIQYMIFLRLLTRPLLCQRLALLANDYPYTLRPALRAASQYPPLSFCTSSRAYATVMSPAKRIADRLEKPETDDREYRVIELPNKLEALLVHDNKTDKASAALNVNVGNFSDEEDMPGMAHAVEHLLFMGTKKVASPQPCTRMR